MPGKHKKWYPSSKRVVKRSVGKGLSKSAIKSYTKLGKVANKASYAKRYKKRK